MENPTTVTFIAGLDLSYSELEIQDGVAASSIFMSLYAEISPELISKTRADLLE